MPSLLVILLRGIFGFCPHCGKHRMFKSLILLHERCPNCGLRFEDRPGDFTGTAYLNTVATGAVAVVIGSLLLLFTDVSVPVLLGVGTLVVIATALVLHQPIKGVWIALMYYTEAIKPPEVQQ